MIPLVQSKNREMLRQLRADGFPIVRGAKQAVEDNQRLALPDGLEVKFHRGLIPYGCFTATHKMRDRGPGPGLLIHSQGFGGSAGPIKLGGLCEPGLP